ncbi:hypothetical protein [Mycobacterium marinum]|uniref:hypothetical protein n=1 Tax=Mycobacterium marinum TaxID=1781 RepID=UPI0035639244
MDRSILRRDEFKYLHFTEAQQSGLVHLAHRIHAQSYVASQFVTADSLVDGALPAELDHARGQHVTYSIAYLADSQIEEVSPGTTDPTGHAMATWRIRDIAPDNDFTSLPAYTSTAGALSSDGLDFLRSVDGDPRSILREIGALAKTPMCPAGAVLEIIRDALHRALARDVDEVWFFSIVQSTYETFVKHLGCLTVRPIGNAVRLRKSGVRSHVRLVPVIVEPRRFLELLYRCATTPANPRAGTQLASFEFFAEGLPEDYVSKQIVAASVNQEEVVSSNARCLA